MVSATSGKKQSRIPGTTIPHAASSILYTIYSILCKQEVAVIGSRQFRVHDPVLVRRCGTEGGTGHQGRERGNNGGNRDVGGDGNGHENRNGGGNGNGHENREEVEGERDLGNLRRYSIGELEDVREEAPPKSS